MDLPVGLRNETVSFGLVIVSLVLAWLVSIAFGGWKFGRLARRVEFAMEPGQLTGFLERFHRRAAELGFGPGNVAGQFRQGGAQFGDISSFTHAKVSKQLDIAVDDSAQREAKVQLTLQYLDPIVGDTGESAYRDAVLDYVSGQADAMKLVPNRSFAAVCSLVGGLFTWVALFGLMRMRFEPLLQPIVVLGATYCAMGVIALIAVLKRSGQLTGIGLAVGGIVASLSAVALAGLLTIMKHL